MALTSPGSSGFNRVFPLETYGPWPGDDNITGLLQTVIGYAQAAGGGRVIIPGGEWLLDPGTVISKAWLPVPPRPPYTYNPMMNAPVWVEGEGEGSTILWCNPPGAGQSMFRWDVSGIPAGTQMYGGLRNLLLHSLAPGDTLGEGVVFDNTVFTNAEHVWIRGFNRGVVSYWCQDQAFRDVHCQVNRTGWLMHGYNQVALQSCYANQSSQAGMFVSDGAALSWTDGLMQGSATIAGLIVAPTKPSAVRLHMRNLYFENGAAAPVRALPPPGGVQYAGTIRLDDVNFNGGGALLTEWYGYHIHAANWWSGYGGVYGRFHGCQVYADDLPEGVPGRWLADQNTLNWSHWRGFPGAVGLELEPGSPPYQPVLSPADVAYIAETRAYLSTFARGL